MNVASLWNATVFRVGPDQVTVGALVVATVLIAAGLLRLASGQPPG